MYVLINSQGLIVNKIVLENLSSWDAPDGLTPVEDSNYEIGGTLKNGVYTPPVDPMKEFYDRLAQHQ